MIYLTYHLVQFSGRTTVAKTFDPDLVIGQVYKLAPNQPEHADMIRVVDDSGESYLYPAQYFEPFYLVAATSTLDPLTIHVDTQIKAILQAEARAAHKSISSLVREWIDERLDRPVS